MCEALKLVNETNGSFLIVTQLTLQLLLTQTSQHNYKRHHKTPDFWPFNCKPGYLRAFLFLIADVVQMKGEQRQ